MPSGNFTLGLESEIFCDYEHPSKYYMPKLLMLDKEDNVMFMFVHIHIEVLLS